MTIRSLARRALGPLGAAGLLLLAACGSAAPTAQPPIDRSKMKLTFSEDFARPPSFYDPDTAPNGRWKTNFFFSVQQTDNPRGWEARTLRPNKEMEYYGDPLHGSNPFEWQPGRLSIVAQPNPLAMDPTTHNMPYLSGLMTTEKSFAQRYGYFEARIAMPAGKGLWPAFWLIPIPRMENGHAVQTGQQEIDIFEDIGDRDKLYLTAHHDVANKKVPNQGTVAVDDVTRPHDYGLLWSKDWIAWYIDGREVRRVPNVDFNTPGYMLLNLAVGGTWPGAPDATTPFPARMRIEWVRAYALPEH